MVFTSWSLLKHSNLFPSLPFERLRRASCQTHVSSSYCLKSFPPCSSGTAGFLLIFENCPPTESPHSSLGSHSSSLPTHSDSLATSSLPVPKVEEMSHQFCIFPYTRILRASILRYVLKICKFLSPSWPLSWDHVLTFNRLWAISTSMAHSPNCCLLGLSWSEEYTPEFFIHSSQVLLISTSKCLSNLSTPLPSHCELLIAVHHHCPALTLTDGHAAYPTGPQAPKLRVICTFCAACMCVVFLKGSIVSFPALYHGRYLSIHSLSPVLAQLLAPTRGPTYVCHQRGDKTSWNAHSREAGFIVLTLILWPHKDPVIVTSIFLFYKWHTCCSKRFSCTLVYQDFITICGN